jgi:toxin HigB-1
MRRIDVPITSFGDAITEEFFLTGQVPRKGCGWKSEKKIVARKLDMIDAAQDLRDLRVPPGNRLEKLSGDLAGRYSIRINDRWRVVFFWTDKGATDVAVTDYH